MSYLKEVSTGKRVICQFFLVIGCYSLGVYLLNLGLPWDNDIQKYFFSNPCISPEPRSCWLLDKGNESLNLWLHSMPRIVAWSIAFIALSIIVAGQYWRRFMHYRTVGWYVVLGMGTTSLVVAILKQYSGHYCPGQLAEYGGVIKDKILQHPAPRCFPAGHPSPGFGILAVYFAPLRQSWRKIGFCVGLLSGGILGVIQIARGEHYLSHIVATMLVALCVGQCIAVLSRLYKFQNSPKL